jgi:hypothetical protein
MPVEGIGDDVAAAMVDYAAVRGNASFSGANPRFFG